MFSRDSMTAKQGFRDVYDIAAKGLESTVQDLHLDNELSAYKWSTAILIVLQKQAYPFGIENLDQESGLILVSKPQEDRSQKFLRIGMFISKPFKSQNGFHYKHTTEVTIV